LEKRSIAHEALDNGFLSCQAPEKLQEIIVEALDALKAKYIMKPPKRGARMSLLKRLLLQPDPLGTRSHK
jgi:hypothetical protein